jgi:hypothetical protein
MVLLWKSVFSFPDPAGFCGLDISQAPAARDVYSSGKKKARKLLQERHISVQMPPRRGWPTKSGRVSRFQFSAADPDLPTENWKLKTEN